MTKENTNIKDSSNFDMIIIGAGPGGSSIGVLLAKKRYKILIIDKNPRAGGRMMTIHKNGFHYELFPISGVPYYNSHFEHILNEIGYENDVEMVPDIGGIIIYENENGEMRKYDMKQSNIKMLKTFGVKWWNFKELFQTIKVLKNLATLHPKEIEKLHDISSQEYLDQFPLPKGIRTFILASFGEGAFELTSDKTSAAEMVKIFQVAMKNGGGRYYKNGIGYVFEIFTKAIQDFGGTALFRTRVEKIIVENGKVSGVETKDGKKYYAPIIISNAGLKQTVFKLIGKEHFKKNYLEWVSGLEYNLACVGYRWIIDKPILDTSSIVLFPEGCIANYAEFEEMANGIKKPEKNYIYLGTTSVFGDLAPEGKQLVYACMSCLPDPKIDIEPYLTYVKSRVKQLYPEILDHVERTESFGPATVPSVGTDSFLPGQGGESYGLALSVGQTGKKQPKGDSPIEGLFHVGCDAGGSGLGTHQAVDSALNVIKLVIKKVNKK